MKFSKNIKLSLINFITTRTYTCLAVAVTFFFLSVPFIPQQNFDFGPQAWFGKGDENIEILKRFERTFGSDESIILLIHLDEDSPYSDIFEPEVIKVIDEMTERMWQVPHVLRSESLINYHWTRAFDEELVTEAFIDPNWMDDDERLQEAKEEALKHRVISRAYLSEDAKSTLIYGHLVHNPNVDLDNKEIVQGLKERVEEFVGKDNGISFKIIGQPYLSDRYKIVSFRDIFIITPILLVLMMLYLWWNFKSINGVFIPMSIIVTTLSATIGLNGFLFLTVNTLTFILPSILMAISIADSVHLLSTFYHRFNQHGDWDRALRDSLDKNLWPIFLTSISTAFGFFSLTVSTIEPVVNLGLMAGFGVLFAMVFSFLLVIPMLSFVGQTKRKELKGHKLQNKVLPPKLVEKYVDWLTHHSGKILLSFFVVSLLGLIIALNNEINSNPFRYFKSHDPITKANEYILDNYSGASGPELLIDSGVPQGAIEPDFMKRVDKLKDWIESQDRVNHVMGIIDILKETNQALHEGDPDEYRIHDRKDVIAQEIFLYTMGLPQGMDLNNRIDYDNQKIRLSVLWALQDSRESLDMVSKIEDKAKSLNLDLTVTGKGILFQQMNDYVVMTFFGSMGTALLLITCLMIGVFGSFFIGLMSLIPNFVPVILGAGLLSLLQTPIEIASAIIASVTLGIAVDDTIHFLSHYAQVHRKKMRLEECKKHLVEIISTTGLALVMTTLILVSCFGLFIFADLRPNMIFGLMSAFVISLALICDLFILPALILYLKKREEAKLNLN